MYDPEAVYQDADVQMHNYAIEAASMRRAERQGVCFHSSLQGEECGAVTCRDCGKRFATWDDAFEACDELLAEWT